MSKKTETPMTVREASDFIGISVHTVRYIAENKLQTRIIRDGKRYILLEELSIFLKDNPKYAERVERKSKPEPAEPKTRKGKTCAECNSTTPPSGWAMLYFDDKTEKTIQVCNECYEYLCAVLD
ncbi:MAG: hypothetical protein HXX08_11120 [Chloroflexi bacterium]|uniref:Helix-turn-helix domain-containing protein n=1 Tax=Candidatus Chlorohelix allophototropha TaxID=3003348 RepID=A0A8T7M263_9CHLR|nr:hypothetical protein [Chloroflexota bacterium]WJW65787.1 hypothetical protein OZ401_001566 [Chloroflexota bacterium L227-S17]